MFDIFSKSYYGDGVEMTPSPDEFLQEEYDSGRATCVLIQDPFENQRYTGLISQLQNKVTAEEIITEAVNDLTTGDDDGWYRLDERSDALGIERSLTTELYDHVRRWLGYNIVPFSELAETEAEIYGVFWTSYNTIAIFFMDGEQMLYRVCNRPESFPLPRSLHRRVDAWSARKNIEGGF